MNPKLALAFGADVLIVLGFAAAGRSTHDSGGSVAGTLTTAAPFLLGLVVGWAAILLIRRRPPTVDAGTSSGISSPTSLVAGITIWATTLIFGLGLRILLGGTAALPFILVAMAVLGAGLIGWRLVALVVRRLRTHRSATEPPIRAK